MSRALTNPWKAHLGSLLRIRSSNPEKLDKLDEQPQYRVNGRWRCRDKTLTTLLFLEIAMLVWCEVVLDVYTREVVSFAISDPTICSKTKGLLQAAIRASGPGRSLVLDRSRLDVWVMPGSA
jgi:transposase InsO family protein